MESTRPASGIPKPSGLSRIPMARSTRPPTAAATPSIANLPPAPPGGRFDVKDINLSASTASLLPKPEVRAPPRTLLSTRAAPSSLVPPTLKTSPAKKVISHTTSKSSSPASSPAKPVSPLQKPSLTKTVQPPPPPRMFETAEDIAIFESLASLAEAASNLDDPSASIENSPDSLTALWEEDAEKLAIDYRFKRNDGFTYMVYEKVYGFSDYLSYIDEEYEKNIDVFGTRLVFEEDPVA